MTNGVPIVDHRDMRSTAQDRTIDVGQNGFEIVLVFFFTLEKLARLLLHRNAVHFHSYRRGVPKIATPDARTK
jgi:hypothetical protein